MELDWNYVKEKTLWQYDELLKKILRVFSFTFVRKYYNQTMPAAKTYARGMQPCLFNEDQVAYIKQMIKTFDVLNGLKIRNYTDLISRIHTKNSCEKFVLETRFEFRDLIDTLHFLFRWVLPFEANLNALVDKERNKTILAVLKEHGIKTNLEILEKLRTRKSRKEFCQNTAVSTNEIVKIVHHADVSRMAYVRGKTIKHLFGGGYDTLDKLANANMGKMVEDMTAYYQSIGKKFSDFKAVIPLEWMTGFAKILPKIVEE